MGDSSDFVAVLPASVLSYLPDDFEYIYPMVDEAVRKELTQRGLRVIPENTVYTALEANSAAILSKIQSSNAKVMSKGIADLIWRLKDEESVSVVIIPQVLEQSILLERPYESAGWNGVVRGFHINGDRETGKELQVDTASVIVGVYNRFGQAIYFGQGGLDFLENATRGGDLLYLSPKISGQIPIDFVQEGVSKAMMQWQLDDFKAIQSGPDADRR